jgi:glycosyltransferase involved in cell wall biosynthesis
VVAVRIAYVGTLPPHTGGSGISAGQLLCGVANAGHTVCAIAPITAAALASGDWFAARHPELRVVRYLLAEFYTRAFLPPSKDFLDRERVLVETLLHEAALSLQPDFVLAGREMMVRYVPAVAAKLGLPFIQMVRGSPTGHILNGTYEYEEDARLMLEGMRRAAAIITVSDYFTNGLKRLGFDRVITIPNAVDNNAFSPRPPSNSLRRELDIAADRVVVLVAANFHGRKRPLDVVNSAALALKQNPRLVYIMCGVGDLEEDVKRMCREKNIEQNFRLPGWVAYERMPEYARLADIAIIASEAEGMARSYLEAMACECVLVASDIPPAEELVDDRVTGLLFRMGDVKHLAARTLEAAADPAMRAAIGKRARERVLPRTIDSAVDAYLQEFEQVLARQTTPSAGSRQTPNNDEDGCSAERGLGYVRDT